MSLRNFMNKHQKPVLTGQRFKTRKRGSSREGPRMCCTIADVSQRVNWPLQFVYSLEPEMLTTYNPALLLDPYKQYKLDSCCVVLKYEKEKFEPTVFRDTLVQGLNEAGDDLEAVAKFLDSTGSRLDYRRYADTLFDILVAGNTALPLKPQQYTEQRIFASQAPGITSIELNNNLGQCPGLSHRSKQTHKPIAGWESLQTKLSPPPPAQRERKLKAGDRLCSRAGLYPPRQTQRAEALTLAGYTASASV
ncbi:hypothetical protein P7K49_025283 [Saguinus oedipus]|uniref:5MP1/2-like HEAT domain-containing protein n=1 Tax=Saguinus oedipus TaxID=9490 RepID=A0ABQ9UHG9_SAGOE|nr:hypothetical protein P7K49_025283 [Saguinus oedipus]